VRVCANTLLKFILFKTIIIKRLRNFYIYCLFILISAILSPTYLTKASYNLASFGYYFALIYL